MDHIRLCLAYFPVKKGKVWLKGTSNETMEFLVEQEMEKYTKTEKEIAEKQSALQPKYI